MVATVALLAVFLAFQVAMAILGALAHVADVLLVFLVAWALSYLLEPAVAAIDRGTRLDRTGAVIIVYVAIGVVLVQLPPGYQASLFSFLFGDILTVGTMDIVLTLIVTAVTLTILTLFGKKFISIAFNPSLAKAEGIPVALHETLFLLTLAAVIALAIKLVGVILVTALLVIPAASAHNLARSLASMFLLSVGLNVVAVIVGMLASVFLNTASGPTIILVSTAFFILSLLLRPLLARVPA